jgi:hypothetical protein
MARWCPPPRRRDDRKRGRGKQRAASSGSAHERSSLVVARGASTPTMHRVATQTASQTSSPSSVMVI